MDKYYKLNEQKFMKVTEELSIEDKDEVEKFVKVCAFLSVNPSFLSWRGKNRPTVTDIDGIRKLAEKFFVARNKKVRPSSPTTVPDEAVSIVMEEVYNYSNAQTKKIKVEHQHSMSAENIVGSLLERYIASVLEPYGWVWCAGDFVKAIDFIKYVEHDETPWIAVQVKNRDNTENSSSAAIRDGKPIEKWFRTYSKTGKDNWQNFPEEEFRGQLSEQGFRDFIRDYLKSPQDKIVT
jgi:hypothetical protein